MKKLLYTLIILSIPFQALLAQTQSRVVPQSTPFRAVDYDAMKRNGQMNPHVNYQQINPNPSPSNTRVINDPSRSIVCNCDIPLDSTFQVAQFDCSGGSGGPGIPPEYRNDDWSTCAIPLPFTICLYGTNYTELYINNNGNVSFGAPYSTFTSLAFPNNQYVMIAPFWADVDTRNDSSGIVYYKVTPTAIIVKWDSVGYYGIHANLLNTFQLIITNGSDPLLPGGNNVSFCYGDMQWTTGDASQGTDGFGGTAATIGANLGDGINYIQFGQFDHAGNDYNGPTGISGVSWLDNQSILFNTCTQNNNVSPVQVGLNQCDTISICSGDTVDFNVAFYSPEVNQITTATATTTALGFTILSDSTGNTAYLSAQLIANPANAGYNVINFSGTDNNVPPATTTVPIVVYIRPFAAPVPVISGPNSFCAPGSVTLSVQSGYSGVLWSTGATTDSITVGAGTYSVIVTDSNGCHATAGPFTVTVNSSLSPSITGGQGVCPNNTTQISVASTYSQYQWSTSANTQSINVGAGTYTVTVTDAAGCTGTATFNVAQYPQPTLVPCGNPSICLNDSASLCITGADSYAWSPATGLSATTGSSVMASPTVTTTYQVIGQSNTTQCSDTASITVTVNPLPLVATPPAPSICSGGSVQICMSGAATYTWQPQTGITTASGPDSTCVTVSLTASATYTVTGFSAEGCSATTTIVVTVNPNPVAAITPLGPTVFCSGGSVDLQASPAGTYVWSNSASTQIINVTASGTFTVIVTDANGCTGTSAPVTVTTNPLPTPAISGSLAFCQGDSAVLTATGGSSYVWSNNSTSANLTVNASGTYTVTATDANGCISSTSITVSANPPPPAVISPAGPVLICSNNPATLSASTGPGYTYQWYLNGNPIANATNSTYDASVTGAYSVRVTDALGCTSLSTDVQVQQGVGPVVTIQGPPQFGCLANTIYIGYGPQSATLTAVSTTAVSYLWSTGATTQSISVTTSGSYSVTAYDANGCPSDTSPDTHITITVVDIRCGNGLKKILFCHVPEGNPGNPQTICIAPTAVTAHLALHQYDCIGPCSLYYPRLSEQDETDELNVTLYPNPFSNTFIIALDNYHGETVMMNMYDVTGRLIISEMKLTDNVELGADLNKGVYNVEIIAGEKREFYKIVKL